MSLLDRLEKQKSLSGNDEKKVELSIPSNRIDEYSDLKRKIHNQFIEIVNQQDINLFNVQNEQEEQLIKTMESIIEARASNLTRAERNRLLKETYDDVMGLGPLEPLLSDGEITEIMVNGPYKVYVERKGKLELSDVVFRDENHVLNVINRIVSSVGRRIDEASPMVDARLKDGSRFNAIIPPLSLIGPSMTIRKFSKKPYTANDLVKFNQYHQRWFLFGGMCTRLNIIVSGGTGSGKQHF